jgi:structure-specific recognition protein 1
MRLWVPGQQAPAMQAKILAQAADLGTGASGPPLVEFDRDQGTFVLPKNRYAVELYDTYLRLHGAASEFKVKYSDVSRFYMLEKPSGGGRQAEGEVQFFYFVICLQRPVRQGQQSYPYLVWQTVNEDTEVTVNMTEAEMEAKYPGSGLKPAMAGALHKHVGKLFKVLSGKTVFAGSRKYRSASGAQSIGCNLGQRNGVLYPNDKSFVFLHQPTMVVEYAEVEFVEFVKAQENPKSFEFIVAKKASAGGKTFKFGAIEKKEFNALAEFVKSKEAFFAVRNYQPEEAAADDDSQDDEEDGDFGSDDGKASGSSSSDSDDTKDGSEDEAGSGDEEVAGAAKKATAKAPKSEKSAPKAPKAAPSPKKKKKKDPNAPKGALSAYMLFGNYMRGVLKEQSPELSFTEVGKELGARWKDMGVDAKQEWQGKADADKQRHAAEMADYVPPSEDEEEERGGKGKKPKVVKDPNAPKKPMGAYFLWMGEARAATKAANPEATTGELSKVMGVAWKALGEEEKAPFHARAQDEATRYKEAMAAYKGGEAAPASKGLVSRMAKSMETSDAEEEDGDQDEGAAEDEDEGSDNGE